jgi:hypothetical protein
MDNPMDSLRKLMESIDKALEEIHVHRVGFTAVPGEDGQPDNIAMIFEVNKEAFMSSDQIRIDSEFDNLISGIIHEDAEEKKMSEIKKLVTDWMDDED